jgi:hypothetical protein
MDGNNNWKEYNEPSLNISKAILSQDYSILLTRDGKIEGVNIDYSDNLPDIIDIFGDLMLLTSGYKIISLFYMGENDNITTFKQYSGFENIDDITKAIDADNKRIYLTKKKEIYLDDYKQIIKLNIKAKNIFNNSIYITMII